MKTLAFAAALAASTVTLLGSSYAQQSSPVYEPIEIRPLPASPGMTREEVEAQTMESMHAPKSPLPIEIRPLPERSGMTRDEVETQTLDAMHAPKSPLPIEIRPMAPPSQ